MGKVSASSVSRDARRLTKGLAADPRIGVLAFIAADLLNIPVSEIATWVKCDRHILETHVTENTARFQQLATLPMALAVVEVRRRFMPASAEIAA